MNETKLDKAAHILESLIVRLDHTPPTGLLIDINSQLKDVLLVIYEIRNER